MNALAKVFIILTCGLFLQSCGHTLIYDKDTLRSSHVSAALPQGSIHTPTEDDTTQFRIQAAAAVSGQWPVTLSIATEPSWSLGWLDSTVILKRARMSFPTWQGSASLAAIFQGKLRLGVGFDRSVNGLAKWGDAGFRWGKEWGAEWFVDLGTVPVRAEAHWISERIWKNYTGHDSSRQIDTSLIGRSDRFFWRTGLHFARRSGGPWLEGQWTRISLFTSPSTSVDFMGNVLSLGAGWTQPTRFGALVAYGRASVIGTTWLPPQVGLQWTGEMGL